MKSNQLYPEDSSAKRKIISYAYLAQASKSDGDLIGGISPIFKPIAKIKTGQVFEPKEFREIVNDLYGLKILPWAAEDLVRRLEHNEILVKNNVVDKVDEYLYAEIKEEFTEVTDKDIIFLTDKFINFSRPILGQYELAIDEATLAKDFLEHLTDLNFISIALSPTQYDENEQSENTLSLKVGEQSEQEISARRNLKEEFQEKARLNMLCASFVLDAYNSNQQLYELIVRIVSGALVAEMVLNFQEPEVDADLSQVTFIFDTPLLMAIMDLSSEKEHEFAIGLFKDMASKGAKFAVYEHSADELRSNLKAVKQKHEEKRSFGATARRLKGESFFRYFEEVRKNPESSLDRLNISIFKTINSSTSQKHFSDEDESAFFNSLGSFKNEIAQERDVYSVSQTMRYRNGIKTKLKEFYAYTAEACHPFHVKAATRTGAKLPPIGA